MKRWLVLLGALTTLTLAACGDEGGQKEDCWDEIQLADGAALCVPPPYEEELAGVCAVVTHDSPAVSRYCSERFDPSACPTATVMLFLDVSKRTGRYAPTCVCPPSSPVSDCQGPWYEAG